MSDKMRRTFPMAITFGDGEQPTAAKLSRGFEQSRYGMAIIERAVGDVWNQSGDATLHNNYGLQIPNLARVLGEQKFVNPALFPTGSQFNFKDLVGERYLGKYEGKLRFPVLTVVSQTGTACVNEKSSRSSVSADGDYYVDTSTGRFWTYSPIDGQASITYTTELEYSTLSGDKLLPSVIPDPRQEYFRGCRIEKSGGNYYLHLPPRQPIRDANWFNGASFDQNEKPFMYPSSDEIDDSENRASDGSSPFLMWQDSANALPVSHYRYNLPPIIDWISSAVVPDNYMFLWDDNAHTIIEDLSFVATSDPWKIQILTSTQTAFLDSKDTGTSEAEVDYSSSGLSLIVAGAPTSVVLMSLYAMMLKHTHGGGNILDAPIPHKNLIDPNPTHTPPWPISKLENDDHTYLLSRMGSDGASSRDVYNNAMLGDLVLANSDLTNPTSALLASTPDGSFGVFYGNTSGRYHKTDDVDHLLFGVDTEDKISFFLQTGSSAKVGLNTVSPSHAIEIAPEDTNGINPVLNNADPTVMLADGTALFEGISANAFPGKHTKFVGTRIDLAPYAPSNTFTGQGLVELVGQGYHDSTGKVPGASIFLDNTADATPTGIATDIIFKTSDGGALVDRWKVDSSGSLLSMNGNTLGSLSSRVPYIYCEQGDFQPSVSATAVTGYGYGTGFGGHFFGTNSNGSADGTTGVKGVGGSGFYSPSKSGGVGLYGEGGDAAGGYAAGIGVYGVGFPGIRGQGTSRSSSGPYAGYGGQFTGGTGGSQETDTVLQKKGGTGVVAQGGSGYTGAVDGSGGLGIQAYGGPGGANNGDGGYGISCKGGDGFGTGSGGYGVYSEASSGGASGAPGHAAVFESAINSAYCLKAFSSVSDGTTPAIYVTRDASLQQGPGIYIEMPNGTGTGADGLQISMGEPAAYAISSTGQVYIKTPFDIPNGKALLELSVTENKKNVAPLCIGQDLAQKPDGGGFVVDPKDFANLPDGSIWIEYTTSFSPNNLTDMYVKIHGARYKIQLTLAPG